MNALDQNTLTDIRYIKLISIGSVNPSIPFSEQSKKQQAELMNRCLNDYPKGRIIGKDVSFGTYRAGGHELTMERVTYHIGFCRKPAWEEQEETG